MAKVVTWTGFDHNCLCDIVSVYPMFFCTQNLYRIKLLVNVMLKGPKQ